TPQYAEAILGVIKRDPLNEAGKHLTGWGFSLTCQGRQDAARILPDHKHKPCRRLLYDPPQSSSQALVAGQATRHRPAKSMLRVAFCWCRSLGGLHHQYIR